MFNVIVEWADEDKSRARFSLPGRQEWRAEHLDALIQLLGEIRAEMSLARLDGLRAAEPGTHPDHTIAFRTGGNVAAFQEIGRHGCQKRIG
jgi:hypothetical protein